MADHNFGELRCPSRIVGRIVGGRFEVKCSANKCGALVGVVVLHYFDLENGELVETKRFRDPVAVKKSRNHIALERTM